MRILVTGHKGFIGRALVAHLEKQGHDVVGLDVVDGNDIRYCDLPPANEVDLVVHLAGKSGLRDSADLSLAADFWSNNVIASRRLFMHYANTRVIYASSSSVYEHSRNIYAASKYAVEDLANRYLTFGIGLRLHTVYSSAPRKGMFFDKLLSGTLEFKTTAYRDFIHINDVLHALDCIIENQFAAAVFDVGTGQSVRIDHLVRLYSANPNSIPLVQLDENERKHTKANIAHLKTLGFEPKISVEEFLQLFA
jgi:nucleoside-diphosphate-sugar epimerase